MWLTRMLYSFITERLIAIYRYNNLCQFVSANIVPLCGFSNDVVVITCHFTAAAPRKYKTRLRQSAVSHLTKIGLPYTAFYSNYNYIKLLIPTII